jgi:hypothetical protein
MCADVCCSCLRVCVRARVQLGDFLVEDRFIDGPMVATMPGATHDRQTPEEEREEIADSDQP